MDEDDVIPPKTVKPPYPVSERYLAPSTLDTRWLWSVAIVVPLLVGAGVFWLHYQPSGPRAQPSGPVVEVRLVQEAAPEPARKIARPHETTSEGVTETLVEDPHRPIPEEATISASAPASAPPTPAINRGTVTAIAKPKPVLSGTASEYQRKLLAHIARFRPTSVLPGQHGIAQVMFSMRRDGTVMDIWVRRSSGHLALDEDAVETIRRAQPLPSIPADLPSRMTITIPIVFDPA